MIVSCMCQKAKRDSFCKLLLAKSLIVKSLMSRDFPSYHFDTNYFGRQKWNRLIYISKELKLRYNRKEF